MIIKFINQNTNYTYSSTSLNFFYKNNKTLYTKYVNNADTKEYASIDLKKLIFFFNLDLNDFKSKIIFNSLAKNNFLENSNKKNFNVLKNFNRNYVFFLKKFNYDNISLFTFMSNFIFFKTFQEITKIKIQKKKHTFYKNVRKTDLFSKKLFLNNLEFINTKVNPSHLIKINEIQKNIFFLKKNKTNLNLTDFYNEYVFEEVKTRFSDFFWKFTLKELKVDKFIKKNFSFKKNQVVLKKKLSSRYAQNIYLYNLKQVFKKKENFFLKNFSFLNETSQFNNFLNNKKINTYNYYPNSSTIYNNFLPYHNFNVKNEFYKKIIIKNILMPKYIVYYNYHLINFLEIYTKKQIWFKINTNSPRVISSKMKFFIKEIYYKNRNDCSHISRHFYLLEFLEILFITFFYRDLKFFSIWFKKMMEKIHLKKHKRMLKLIHNLMKNNQEYLPLLNVKGFSMDVRGKLSSAGNSKKRHYNFCIGALSPTSKNHDLIFNQTTINTTTGVLGVSIFLSF